MNVTSARVGAVFSGLNQLHGWRGRTVVVKYGGAAMQREDCKTSFAWDIVRLHSAGVRPVVVHGGGPQIDGLMRRLGLTPRFIGGLRVTDEDTMELVEMVLVGKINSDLVGRINQHGGRAIGLSGKDADLIVAHRHDADLGLVGDVDIVNADLLRLMLESGLIPVIAPVATGREGETYNVNADHVAASVAAALNAALLLELTDVPGVLDGDGHILRTVDRSSLEELARNGAVHGGMLPKMDAARRALDAGVASVRIADGRRPHALVLALLAPGGVGTEIAG